MAKVIWSDDALDDLSQVVSYIALNNRAAAIRTGMKIVERAELLGTFPRMGSIYIEEENIRRTLVGAVWIYYTYEPQNDTVVIENVWHTARQDPNFDSSETGE